MYQIQLVGKTYRYAGGPFTVGIIPPSRQKHIATINEIRGKKSGPIVETGIRNGMHDSRVSVEEIASYILKNQIK